MTSSRTVPSYPQASPDGDQEASPGPLLTMRGITKSFPGVTALEDVDITVRPGTVHALCGENGAGKTTLMNVLAGLVEADGGEIRLGGQVVKFATPAEAMQAGISMIQQELHPVPARSVMENIWLGRFPRGRFGLVDHDRMRRESLRLFSDIGVDLDPDAKAGDLSVSQVQLMEIGRAVSFDARVVIMDEPTSSLSEHEVQRLYGLIGDLRARGVAVIYISHKLEEVMTISDEVSVMRDGRMVGTWPTASLTIGQVITRMVGRDLTDRYPGRQVNQGEVLLEVDRLTSPLPGSFRDVSFRLHRGEVLGIGGLVGAQRTELVEAIFGLRAIESGRILVSGREVVIRSPIDAKRLGMALLTEDRRDTGVVPTRSVFENVLLAHLPRYANRLGIVDTGAARDDAQRVLGRLRVRMPSLQTPITNLSGGNQQKVLLGRWLMWDPEILILDEPTRGIDVGAKFEIYTIINELAAQGKGIIMISSELPELIGESDRIVVMCRGRLTGIVDRAQADEATIMHLATDVESVAEAEAEQPVAAHV
jgi:methyl-galactoside transport system ATP-binding protein